MVIFVFRSDSYLCHHVVTVRIIKNIRSNDDIIFIEPWKLPIVSRYGTEIRVACFDHTINGDW